MTQGAFGGLAPSGGNGRKVGVFAPVPSAEVCTSGSAENGAFAGVRGAPSEAREADGAIGLCNPVRADMLASGQDAFDPVAYINEPRWRSSRLGLARITELLRRLGNPDGAMPIIHVAGTNGKGSICTYLASVLTCAGYRTGLFTSPYIERFEERIAVDGVMISRNDLLEATLAVKEQADAMERETGEHPTEFELMAAVALVHFARIGCDAAVLEVGLGGRLDATNAIAHPTLDVIARIGLDHTDLLGHTLAQIAAEKAGIMRPGVPAVSWPQEPEAMAVIETRAQELSAPLSIADLSALDVGRIQWGAGIRLEGGAGSAAPKAGFALRGADEWEEHAAGFAAPVPDGGLWRPFTYKGRRYRTGMLGAYQPANAAVALEAVEVLRVLGWSLPAEAVIRGIQEARWPGRFEIVHVPSAEPLIIVDGGHNPQGAAALAETLREVLEARGVEGAHLVMSVMADKDYRAMLKTVMPLAASFTAFAPAENPRALPAEDLARVAREIRGAWEAGRCEVEDASRDAGIPICAVGRCRNANETAQTEGIPICAAARRNSDGSARVKGGDSPMGAEGGSGCCSGKAMRDGRSGIPICAVGSPSEAVAAALRNAGCNGVGRVGTGVGSACIIAAAADSGPSAIGRPSADVAPEHSDAGRPFAAATSGPSVVDRPSSSNFELSDAGHPCADTNGTGASGVIVVFGSLYSIGEVKMALGKFFEV